MHDMLSAPKEQYQEHIKNCLKHWGTISHRFLPSLSRVFNEEEEVVNQSVFRMIFSHDVGKLTERWQSDMEGIAKKKSPKPRLPAHSPLGAAYLLEWNKKLGEVNDLGRAAVFAVLIHHIDTGLSGSNLESPDAQIILDGLVQGGEKILWHADADKALSAIFPDNTYIPLKMVTLSHLVELSDDMRMWSKCPKILDQHKHRLIGSSLHHVLKICDWRASAEREADSKERELYHSVLEVLLDGGVLP
jgi:CRISPR-associated endonuclease Cas3-HD